MAIYEFRESTRRLKDQSLCCNAYVKKLKIKKLGNLGKLPIQTDLKCKLTTISHLSL